MNGDAMGKIEEFVKKMMDGYDLHSPAGRDRLDQCAVALTVALRQVAPFPEGYTRIDLQVIGEDVVVGFA